MTALARLQVLLGSQVPLVVVGGAVRDRLLGRIQGDVDLATPLLPEDLMAQAKAAGIRTIPTGLQHGTVTLVVEGVTFEVTTFRGDGDYRDGRRPEAVRLGVALEEDLARRDFTVNAMAVPLEDWLAGSMDRALLDPFGGRGDLQARCLRAVGDPGVRFQEDGLRPLRGCRLVAQLGFDLDPETTRAIPARLDVVQKVAVERVLVELTKLLTASEPARGLQCLEATGLLDTLLPELRPQVGCEQNEHHAWPVWEHTLAVVSAARPTVAHRWAALLHDVGKPESRTVGADGRVHFYRHELRSEALAGAILLRLKASRALQQEVLALVRHHGRVPEPSWSDGACRRFLGRLQEDGLSLADWGAFREADLRGKGVDLRASLDGHRLAMSRLQALVKAHPPLGTRDLALDGRALVALSGRPPGPWVGALQRHLLGAVLDAPEVNTPGGLEPLVHGWLALHPEA